MAYYKYRRRVMCEYEETMNRLKRYNVKGTVLFFGSARAQYRKDHEVARKQATVQLNTASTESERQKAQQTLEDLAATEWMCDYCEQIQSLARQLTQFAIDQKTMLALAYSSHGKIAETPENQYLMVSTGGGGGFMEAANRGAAEIPQAKTIGMLITLPCEPKMNDSVSPELAFQFQYFFSRKFWLVYQCQALVIAPGGYGTLDEVFEVLTMKATGKLKREIPIVLFGNKFWTTIVNWEALISYGVISRPDFDCLFFTDSVQEAYQHITQHFKP